MTRTESKLGIYVVRGEISNGDVFYYHLGRRSATRDEYMAVPKANVFKPYVAHRPPQDREDWVAVGDYNSHTYDMVIGTELLAAHQRRVTLALLEEIERKDREKQWYADRLGEVTQERNTFAESDVKKGDLAVRQAGVIAEIRHLLEELEG